MLIPDPELRQQLGRSARVAVRERFDRAENVKDLMRILDLSPATSPVTLAHRASDIAQCTRS